MKKPRSKWLVMLYQIVAVYVGLLVFLYVRQGSMLYFPKPTPPDKIATGFTGIEDVVVTTADGLAIKGWYLPPVLKTKPTIIFFHGNAGNIQWSLYKMPAFITKGYGVLLAEYRGYSGNPGMPTESGLYDDARAYINWLKAQGVSESNIILYAESLGTGVAVQMAIEYPPFNTIILEAPYSSIAEVAADIYWFVPVRYLIKERYDSLDKIGQIKSPLIVVHGEKDTVIPYFYGKKLFDAAPQPKTMITVPDAGHNNLGEHGSAEKILGVLTE